MTSATLTRPSTRPHALSERSSREWVPTRALRTLKKISIFLSRPDAESTKAFQKHVEFRKDQQALIQSGIHLL